MALPAAAATLPPLTPTNAEGPRRKRRLPPPGHPGDNSGGLQSPPLPRSSASSSARRPLPRGPLEGITHTCVPPESSQGPGHPHTHTYPQPEVALSRPGMTPSCPPAPNPPSHSLGASQKPGWGGAQLRPPAGQAQEDPGAPGPLEKRERRWRRAGHLLGMTASTGAPEPHDGVSCCEWDQVGGSPSHPALGPLDEIPLGINPVFPADEVISGLEGLPVPGDRWGPLSAPAWRAVGFPVERGGRESGPVLWPWRQPAPWGARGSSLALTVAALRVDSLIRWPHLRLLPATSLGTRPPPCLAHSGGQQAHTRPLGESAPPPLLLTSKRLGEQKLLGLGLPLRPRTVCPADALPRTHMPGGRPSAPPSTDRTG